MNWSRQICAEREYVVLQLSERNHKLLGVFGVPSLQSRADCYCNRELGWGWDGVKATVSLGRPGEGLFN